MTQTKKALIMSIFSMMLCMAMLMGTTFAWFTDTASTAVNTVQAGNLKVDIVEADGETSIANQSMSFGDSGEVHWEPGTTFTTEGFRIKNNGNLSLKYRIMINLDGIDDVLRDNMNFYIVSNGEEIAYPGGIVEGHLDGVKADDAGTVSEAETATAETNTQTDNVSETFYVRGEMKGGASDECQGKELKNISVTVIATQDTMESDSNGTDYDADAAYPAKTWEILKNTLEKGGAVQLDNDITIKPEIKDAEGLVPQITVNKDASLDLNGKTLGIKTDDFGEATPVLIAVTGGTFTVNGDGVIDCAAGSNQVYGINVNGGDVVINGGKFYGGMTAIQVQKGGLEINGGFFDIADYYRNKGSHDAKHLIKANGTANISIMGGTFVNFDPSDNPEGEGTSYVATGYKVVSETHGDETWYTVVKDSNRQVD